MVGARKRVSLVKGKKKEYDDLGGHMHHLAHSMTKNCAKVGSRTMQVGRVFHCMIILGKNLYL